MEDVHPAKGQCLEAVTQKAITLFSRIASEILLIQMSVHILEFQILFCV